MISLDDNDMAMKESRRVLSDIMVGKLKRNLKDARLRCGEIYKVWEKDKPSLHDWFAFQLVFIEQRCQGTMQIWAETFTRLRVPKIFNLRTDPYEYADTTSNSYWDWVLHNIYFLYLAQAAAKKFAETFQEFPAIQKPNTFTINDALAKMSRGVGGSR